MKKQLLFAGAAVLLVIAVAPEAMGQTASRAASSSAPSSRQGAATASTSDSSSRSQSDTVGEIIVTAQRREQTLEKVPIAVSVVSAPTLSRAEAHSSSALVQMVPNLSGGQNTGAGSSNNYSLRGLYNADTAATFDSPVGTYIDDIFVARINLNNFELFDVDNIQVLRGPQGTLFGRNTTGGAILVTLKKPSDTFDGFGEVEGGNFGHYQVRGAVDVPITPWLQTRLAAYDMGENGWAKDTTTGGTVNAHSGYGVRGAARAELPAGVVWDVSADYVHDNDPNLPVDRGPDGFYSRSGLQALGSILTGKKGQIPGNVAINDTYGVTSHIHVPTPVGMLDFITGYRYIQSQFNLDYFDNPSPIGGYDSVEYSGHAQVSQEIKLTGSAWHGFVDYTAGLFYFHEGNETDYAAVFNVGAPLVLYDRTLYNSTTSYAAYGQADFHLTSRLTGTIGLRWTSESKKIHYVDNGNPRAITHFDDATLLADNIPLSQHVAIPTPRFAIQYQFTDDVMGYASATRGFKSGGWNIRGTNIAAMANFGPEKVWSYEGGLRTELFQHKVRFNVTGFYGYTNDLQIATAVASPGGGAPQFPEGNYADFESYGVEAEATWVPIENLTLAANFGYDHTAYKKPLPPVLAQQAACLAGVAADCGQGIITPTGAIAHPARAPEFTGGVSAMYQYPIWSDWRLVPFASIHFSSSYNVNTAELPITQYGGYNQIQASLSLERKDDRLAFEVGCENCNGDEYLLSVIGGHYFWSQPRRIYVKVRYGF